MIKIEVKSNFNTDEIMQQILDNAREQIADKARSVYCSEHNQYPSVTIHVISSDKWNVEIEGCCDDLVERATEAMS